MAPGSKQHAISVWFDPTVLGMKLCCCNLVYWGTGLSVTFSVLCGGRTMWPCVASVVSVLAFVVRLSMSVYIAFVNSFASSYRDPHT